MPYDPNESGTDRVDPFHRIYRHLRCFAERLGNDLCRALERRFLDDEIPVGGQR